MATALYRPWGMTRATPPHIEESPPPWVRTILDPGTQLTIFLDAEDNPIDLMDGTNKHYVTVTASKPGDGAKNAPEKADDSSSDQKDD